MNAPKVVTQYIQPPVPTTRFDWCAWFDGMEVEGPYGWGPTETAAKRDLDQQFMTNYGWIHGSDDGHEEGQKCNRTAYDLTRCTGTIVMESPIDCSCHICPPCSACMDCGLTCPACGWRSKDEESPGVRA